MQNDSDKVRIKLAAEGHLPRYWYAGGNFVACETDGSGVFVDLGAGRHTISVIAGGAQDSRSVEVARAAMGGGEVNVLR